MIKNIFKCILLIFYLIITSCDSLKKNIGIEKDLPNEFLIKKRDSLKLPPDYKIIEPDTQNQKSTSSQSNSSLEQIIKEKLEQKNSNQEINENSNLEDVILNQIK